MKQKTLLDVLSEDDGSVGAVLVVIERLREELRSERTDDWENPTLEQFLGAMHAWLATMGPRAGEKPSWKFVEIMIEAAKLYE
jgi:hypothetical protein